VLFRSRGWADWIAQATGGRLTIKIAEPNTIYPNADFVPNLGKGVIEAQFVNPSFAGGVIPENNIFGGVPFAYTDWTQWYDWYYQFGGIDIAQAVNAEKNLLYIPEPDPVITQVVTAFPCRSVKDLKGRKIRSPANMTQFLQAVGATTVTMAYTDTYMGIKLGTVEGYAGGLQSIEDIKLKEVCKGAVVNPPVAAANNALFINMDAFNKLPDDIKGIIKRDTKYYLASAALQSQVNYLVSLNRVVLEYPFELWKWSDEDVTWTRQQCMEKIWPALAAPNARCAQILESIKAHMKSLGLTK
jgi:TRAP-type C4-dicarboxylate transport system substrate-binding protein